MYIVIAGAGLVGGELARKLIENKHDVVVIDVDKERCDKLYAECGAITINGSATRIETLKEAEIEKADVAVAATGRDADNLAFSILAKSFHVPEVIVRMSDPDYGNAYKVVGVNSIVRINDLMVGQMIMEVEKRRVRKICSIGGARAEIFVVIVPQGARISGMAVKNIAADKKFPSECVVVAVYNPEREMFCIPRGDHVVHEEDEIFIVAAVEDIKKAVDFLTETKPA